MAYAAPQGDGQIGRIHNLAIRQEIGERLCSNPDPELAELPPHLLLLMKRFPSEPLARQGSA